MERHIRLLHGEEEELPRVFVRLRPEKKKGYQKSEELRNGWIEE
ncbi:hypothetical protein Gotur_027440, partial [Gossypium turneri]